MRAKPTAALRSVPERNRKVPRSAPAGVADPASPPIAARLAAFAEETRAEDIPEAVRTRAVHHMLDAAGIALAAARYDFAQRMLDATRGLGGDGTVPVIGMPARLSPRDAAMVNGFLCHGLDFDDTHVAGIVHPTASVFPAVMSAAALTGTSGREVVTAFVIGVEAAARLGMVARGGFHQVGFHPTGMIGVFGCALAAGRLMGLTPRQLAMAQGIALSLASGSLEFLEDGAWNKRLHPGWAAQAGITAAALAREGFVGATRPYDGRFGVFRSYLGTEAAHADHALATKGLGETWELMATAIKPYPACHFTHAAIDCAIALVKGGLDWRRIASVEVRVPQPVFKTICEPEANKLAPANGYDAQFSVQYLVAAALVRGRFGLADLEAEALASADVLALTRKVEYGPYEGGPFPAAYSGEVTVTLEDGRKLRHGEAVNRGAADRPLANAEIVAKFRANAATAAGRDAAERMEAALLGLDRAQDPVAVLATFSPARPS
jgi:2-methylcitrate dehydratase PrpD